MERIDLVVVGAGWYGLAAAKLYLELHPSSSLAIVDASATVGGTWAKHRLYPSLKTNNMVGMFHFPDFPMEEASFGVKPGQHVPGLVVYNYLSAYAKRFGISAKIRLNTKVNTIEPCDNDTWLLSTTSNSESPDGGLKSSILAKRLVIATGLTATPRMPKIPDMDSFEAPIFHAKDYALRGGDITSAKNIVVLGCGKSAFDIAYDRATAGATVDMIVHASGKGPIWMAPPYVTPLKMRLEQLVTTRFLTWFSPCTWGDEDGYGFVRSYLHGTTIGRWIVRQLWNVMHNDVISLNGYDTDPGLEKFKPWHPGYYIGTQLSVNNYPSDIYSLVKQGRIRVHVADVTRLSGSTVHLSTGEDLVTDALVCATGWKHKPILDFRGIGDQELGLPYSSAEPGDRASEAEAEILSRFPSLTIQPDIPNRDPDGLNHPYRLYRFVVPPALFAKRNIAFAGMCTHTITGMAAHVQALWISAYFDGALDRVPLSDEALQRETMLHTQALKLRYPLGYGSKHPDFAFDSIPYLDQMLGDLGLQKWRKHGRLAEFTQPYTPDDYCELVEEWKEKHGQHGESKKVQ